jgi:hypothetical protein
MARGLGAPSYYVHGFTDADYFSGATGEGRPTLGTVRLVGVLISRPVGSTRYVCGRSNSTGAARGWYVGTGLGTEGAIGLVSAGTGGQVSPLFLFSQSDVGRLFVVHGTIDSTAVRLYVAGQEIGSGTATGITPAAPLTTERMIVGRHLSLGGFSAPSIGIVALHASPTVMDASAIAADAATIMLYGSRLTIPAIPDQDVAYVASDLVATPSSWPDQAGADATLTRTGTLTLTEVT